MLLPDLLQRILDEDGRTDKNLAKTLVRFRSDQEEFDILQR